MIDTHAIWVNSRDPEDHWPWESGLRPTAVCDCRLQLAHPDMVNNERPTCRGCQAALRRYDEEFPVFERGWNP
jgi:hypothetical protein